MKQWRIAPYVLTLAAAVAATSISQAQTVWVQQTAGPFGKPLYGVTMLDENIVVAVGLDGTILRSSDRGRNWMERDSIGGNDGLKAVAFGNAQVGVAVGF